MDNEVKVITYEKLDKESIFNIARTINHCLDKVVLGGKGKKVADIKHYDDMHVYTFTFVADISDKTSDYLVSELYVKLDFNFMVEIETNIEEDYLEPNDDEEILSELSESVEHAKWIQEQSNNGWRYGMDYDEYKKTNPYMRPHHMLTKSQKNVFRKSKPKLGRYGIYTGYIGGSYNTDNNDVGDGQDGGE